MAKKDVSAIVSGAGLVAGVWTDLVSAVRERGGTDEDIHNLSRPEGRRTIGRMADVIVERANAFPTWRTINLGTHETIEALKQDLNSKGYSISDFEREILKKVTLCPLEVDVELVVASVAELGFPYGAKRQEIYDRASELGLKLCPAEVGPQLRLQYEDQPDGEYLFVAMNYMTDFQGYTFVFCVYRNRDVRRLSVHYRDPWDLWGGSSRLVFLRRK